MPEYYLEIWTPVEDAERSNFPLDVKTKRDKIIHFYNLLDVWLYVLGNKIEHYIVSEAKCVIDQT